MMMAVTCLLTSLITPAYDTNTAINFDDLVKSFFAQISALKVKSEVA
jgi:hypothetical protein